MMNLFPYIFSLRIGEAIFAAAPGFLSGVLIAAILRQYVSQDALARLLDRPGLVGRVQAWVILLVLPVNSFGLLPVLREFHRRSVRRSTLLTCALTGAMTNPWSLAYMATQMHAFRFASLLLGRAAVTLAAGALWESLDRRPLPTLAEPVPAAPPGLLGILRSAGRQIDRRMALYVALGLVGVGAGALCWPPGWIGDQLFVRSWVNIPLVVAIAGPAFVTPEVGALQVAQILDLGTNPGAALTWWMLGPTINLSIFAAAVGWLGFRRTVLASVVTLMTLVPASYALDALLYNGVTAVEDTHVFDGHGRPFHLGDDGSGPLRATVKKVRKSADPSQVIAIGALAALVALRRLPAGAGRTRTAESAAGPWNRPVSRGATWGIVGTAGAASAVLGAYAFVPSPEWIFSEMRRADAELSVAIRRHEPDLALEQVAKLETLTNKLRPSVVMRSGWLRGDLSERVDEYAVALGDLHRAIQQNTADLGDRSIETSRTLVRTQQLFGCAQPKGGGVRPQ